ncbi:MAG: 16S rRNA (cytidine(1402)-2'-O)-methyltransferase [Desulfovibrio sp.]|jgi:16S rRNA (cytidine1402-2'-O)-methyltransferase|nr:16S rRNA (cytidine(1402)-2'-O)-methyltransferase [Desulfovibrio sp.]
MSSNSGLLWVAATPIGNHGDLSPRAGEVLSGVWRILAEDTRRSGLLLARCGVRSPGFLSLHEHNESRRLPAVLNLLRSGRDLALLSDAGTPLLSDPGYRLVRVCREEGIRVSPLPGPSAICAALSAGGIAPLPFAFLGFPPRGRQERERFFAAYAGLNLTLVFFERKDRLAACLRDACKVLGRREACLAREMTKTHEEFVRFFLDESHSLPEGMKGEMTVLIGPPPAAHAQREDPDALIREAAQAGTGARETARRVHARVAGLTLKEIYRRVLELKSSSDP